MPTISRRDFIYSSGKLFSGFFILLKTPQSLGATIETLNVIDFGAKGDGVHDDSYAFQKACSYANKLGGAKIYVPLPPKEYRILFPIYIQNNTEIFGDGKKTKIVFENPTFKKGRGGFVIGSSQESNRDVGMRRYNNPNIENLTTLNKKFTNPAQRQYLRDNLSFTEAKNSLIHDLFIEARFTPSGDSNWGGYGINFVNALNCHAYNIWGIGWTQLIGIGSDVPPESPSNHNCSAKNLYVLIPDLIRTYYSIGFIANSTNCIIDNATQSTAMTSGTMNGSGVAMNFCEDCTISNITIPDLGRTKTSEGVLVNNSSGCIVKNIKIGNAKKAASAFFKVKETVNSLKPNTFDNIYGSNCDYVLAIYSKHNIVKNISGDNSTHIISLMNSNATDNIIYASKQDISAPINSHQQDIINKNKFTK